MLLMLRRRGLRGEEPGDLVEGDDEGRVEVIGVMGLREEVAEERREGVGVVVAM